MAGICCIITGTVYDDAGNADDGSICGGTLGTFDAVAAATAAVDNTDDDVSLSKLLRVSSVGSGLMTSGIIDGYSSSKLDMKLRKCCCRCSKFVPGPTGLAERTSCR